MTENMPQVTILNNILGTKNVIDTAIKKDVSTFVFVSTDKAVNPSNIMGATKRIAEMYVSSLSSKNKTKVITTRFWKCSWVKWISCSNFSKSNSKRRTYNCYPSKSNSVFYDYYRSMSISS